MIYVFLSRLTHHIRQSYLRNQIKEFFRTHIATDELRFGRFQSSYERRLKVSNLFERKDEIFKPIDSQIKQESFSLRSYNDLIKNNKNLNSTTKTNILNKEQSFGKVLIKKN